MKKMNKVYWYKAPTPSEPLLNHELPADAKCVAIVNVNGEERLYFEVDPTAPTTPRMFCIVGTGHEISADAKYCGTYQFPPFVFHVYELFGEGG